MTQPNSAAAAPAAGATTGAAPGAAAGTAEQKPADAKAPASLLGSNATPADKAGGDGTGDKASGPKTDEVALTGAPDTYAEFTVPQGYELDKAAVAEFLPLAKELNLSQAGAQKLVEWDIARAQKANDAAGKEWDDMVVSWQKQAKDDKEIGGAKFDENLALANGVIDKFGTPALKQALVTTMVGNHVEFIRLLTKIGKAMGEGTIKTGPETPDAGKSVEEVLYPTMFKK